MDALARPLAAGGVRADAVTAASVAAAGAAALVPPASGALLVLASAVLDGVDGAVARRTAPTSYGQVLDRSADRLSDVFFVVALRRAGAPRAVASAAVLSTFTFEGVRALRRGRGEDIGAVTVGDRHVRVALTAFGLVRAPSVAAWLLAGAGVVGAVQLAGRFR